MSERPAKAPKPADRAVQALCYKEGENIGKNKAKPASPGCLKKEREKHSSSCTSVFPQLSCSTKKRHITTSTKSYPEKKGTKSDSNLEFLLL